MKTGIELIAKERERQVSEEGYDAKHDDNHEDGELATAAAIYASPSLLYEKTETAQGVHFDVVDDMGWNLDLPYHGNMRQPNYQVARTKRIRQLVMAAALIAAEIDRLQRRDKSTLTSPSK
jgi:hypothetical protein